MVEGIAARCFEFRDQGCRGQLRSKRSDLSLHSSILMREWVRLSLQTQPSSRSCWTDRIQLYIVDHEVEARVERLEESKPPCRPIE